MRTGQNFGLLYTLLLVCQVLLCNYFQFTPYAMLTLLPAMILCVPLTISTIGCMLIAFASGLAVDWFSEGLIGLNAAAILPVAALRTGIVRVFLGEDLISRGDRFSFRKNGVAKISAALILSIAIYLGIYVILDGAGTRPAWFNFTRLGVSLVCNYILALIVTDILTPDERK